MFLSLFSYSLILLTSENFRYKLKHFLYSLKTFLKEFGNELWFYFFIE